MLTIPISFILCLYTAFLLYVLARLVFYAPLPPSPHDSPSLSLVIPFKNEAHNLDALRASLEEQDYCGEWEVVLVNDGSEDDFIPALSRFRDTFGGARFFRVDSYFDPSKRLTSKQQALDTGINSTRYEWVVLTDADMLFEKNWLTHCGANACNGVDLAFGHTAIRKTGHGFFGWCQNFQIEFLFAAAYSLHAAGLDGSCMGNNLLVRKKAYREIGCQAGIGYSIVEDRDLYKEFKLRGRKTAPFEPFSARAFTAPCITFPQFYHQMIRWARGGFSSSLLLLCAALLFSFQNISLIASLCGMAPLTIVYLSVVNFLLTMLFTGLTFWKIHSKENALFFPVYLVFALIEAFVFLVSFVITPKIKWKENEV